MAAFSAGSTTSITLDYNDSLTVVGNADLLFAPTGGSTFRTRSTGTQVFGPLKATSTTVTLTALGDGSYTTSNDNRVDYPVTADANGALYANGALVSGDSNPSQPKRFKTAAKELSLSGGSYTKLGATGTVEVGSTPWLGSQTHHRITTGSASGDQVGYRYRWTSGGPSLSAIGGIVVPVRVEQVGTTPSAEVDVVISNNISAGTANVSQKLYLQGGLTGDQFLYFPIESFVAAGTPTQVAEGTVVVYDIHVQVTNRTAGTAAVVNVGSLYTSCGIRPTISLGWDDGLLSQYTEAFPLMLAAGLRGSIGIAKDYVGQPGYMTEAQITELYRAGWDIVVHGVLAHTDAQFDTRAKLLAEVQKNRDYVASKWPGAHTHYTYIGGALSQWSISVLQELGFVTGRLVNRGAPMGLGVGVNAASWLLMPSSPTFDAVVATRTADIDAAVAQKWAMTELHMHSVNPVGSEPAIETTSRANATTIINKVRDLRALGLIDCLTRSQLYARFAA